MTDVVERSKRTTRSGQELTLIDCDGHVMEYDQDLEPYLDKEFRKSDRLSKGWFRRAIALSTLTRGGPISARVERGEDYDTVVAELTGQSTAFASAADTAHKLAESGEVAGLDERAFDAREQMTTPGGYDPKARLVDMDKEGIDVAVLYPSQMLAFVEDVGLFTAACRAYNNWIREYCEESPGRLYGVGVVPLQDIDGAISEMRRVKDLGFKAVMIRPSPYIGSNKLYHPCYEPFWAAAEDMNMPIGVHPFPFADMPNVCRNMGLDDGLGGLEGLYLQMTLTNALDTMIGMAWFVGGGICDRHPRLKVAFLEATGGWMYPMLERLQAKYSYFGSRHAKTPPMEIFQRQCWVSFDPDEKTLAYFAQLLGPDRILWASDYPHPDTLAEGVVDELLEAVESLPDEAVHQVVGRAAASFYEI